MSKTHTLDLRALSPSTRDNIRWHQTRAMGVIRLGGNTTIYILDYPQDDESPQGGRRLVVRTKADKVKSERVSVKSFDKLMSRYKRLYAHQKLLHGRQECGSHPAHT